MQKMNFKTIISIIREFQFYSKNELYNFHVSHFFTNSF